MLVRDEVWSEVEVWKPKGIRFRAEVSIIERRAQHKNLAGALPTTERTMK